MFSLRGEVVVRAAEAFRTPIVDYVSVGYYTAVPIAGWLHAAIVRAAASRRSGPPGHVEA